MKKGLKRLVLVAAAFALLAGCDEDKGPTGSAPPQHTVPPDVTSEGQANPTPDRLVFSSGRKAIEHAERGVGLKSSLEIYTSFADGSGRKRLTRDLVEDEGAVAYPNTGLIYYVCRSGSICVTTTSGTGTAVAVKTEAFGFSVIEDPAISPDGSRMILTTVRSNFEGTQHNYDLRMYDFSTEEITNLAVVTAQDIMATWASNDTIVWSRLRNGDYDLVSFRLGSPPGSAPTVLTNNDLDDMGVDVSPDGTMLSWIGTVNDDSRRGELFTMPFTGSPETPTSIEPVRFPDLYIGRDPDTAWSPDGTMIAFGGAAPGEDDGEIFTIPANDGPVVNVTDNDLFDVDPEWALVPPSLSIATTFVYREGGSGPLNFEILLDAPQTEVVTVDYATVPGTATAADFTARSGTARFEPGQTRVVVGVPITNDDILEPHESFTLRLTNASPGTLVAEDEASGLISDDEVEPTPTPRPATPTPTPSSSPTPPPGEISDGRIAFASTRGGAQQIYTMTSAGGDVKHVSADQGSSELGAPNWSPDGARIIHTAMNTSGGSPQPEIVDRPSDGTGTFRLLEPDPSNDTDPVYLPGDPAGGFVFSSDRDGDFELYYASPSGGAEKKLTNNSANDGHPSFSVASGGVVQMVFHSNVDGDFDVYRLGVSTSGDPSGSPVNLTPEQPGQAPHDELAPDVALGRNMITYHGNEHGDFDIYTLDLTSLQETHITTDSANETNPSFSPTGSFIAFQKDLGGGNFDVFVMPPTAGATATNITNSPGADVTPEWGPGTTQTSSSSAAVAAFVVGAPGLLTLSLARRRRRLSR